MAAGVRLAPSLLQTAVLIAGAVLLWGIQSEFLPPTASRPGYLVWAVLTAVGLAFLVDFTIWLQGKSRPRALLRLPGEFKSWLLTSLRTVRRFSRDFAWVVLILGALAVLVETRTDPAPYYNLMHGLAIVLTIAVMVRSAAVPIPVATEVFRFPLFRLIALVAANLLVYHPWAAAYGFPNSPLIPALALAVGLSYLGSTLRNFALTSHRWAGEGQAWPGVVAGNLGVAAGLAGAGSSAVVIWACLATLPNVSAALLGQWPYDLVGTRTQPLFSRLFEARYLIAGLALMLVFTTRLPAARGPLNEVNYMPLLKAAGLSLAGCLAWLVGADLAPLGHGYTLIAAMIGTGLFAVALSRLARYFMSSTGRLLGEVAGWLAHSSLRAFVLGAFLAIYGLLLRPLFYDLMWFAPIFEWLLVLTFAVIAMMRSRARIKREVAPGPAPLAAWPDWSRHVQTTEERPDPRMDGLLASQQHFVDTGEWRHMWVYLLGLMLRNQVPLEPIARVFGPLRSCFLASTRFDPWPRKTRRLRRQRERVLLDTIGLAETALACAQSGTEEADEARLWEAGGPFVEEGADPGELAVALAAAYWRNGADLEQAIELWFPLMTLLDRPRRSFAMRAVSAVFLLLRFGRRGRSWDRERRYLILDRAVSHLFREGTHESLAMAILDQDILIDEYGQGYFIHRLPRGQAVEILREDSSFCRFRPGEGSRSFTVESGLQLDSLAGSARRDAGSWSYTIQQSGLLRRPVLPKDYAIAERRLITA